MPEEVPCTLPALAPGEERQIAIPQKAAAQGPTGLLYDADGAGCREAADQRPGGGATYGPVTGGRNSWGGHGG
ncbi:hypothetical protein, partial [Kitasatospora sp. NPDC059803]|uniref:hypothetical protein n=1 Tax=Kitasatospora sp. NPDC059803 TaxID=3346953 RepID=UPI00365343CD